jgi:hypothetical protein
MLDTQQLRGGGTAKPSDVSGKGKENMERKKAFVSCMKDIRIIARCHVVGGNDSHDLDLCLGKSKRSLFENVVRMVAASKPCALLLNRHQLVERLLRVECSFLQSVIQPNDPPDLIPLPTRNYLVGGASPATNKQSASQNSNKKTLHSRVKIPSCTNSPGAGLFCKCPSNLVSNCALIRSAFFPANESPGLPLRMFLSCSSPGVGRCSRNEASFEVSEVLCGVRSWLVSIVPPDVRVVEEEEGAGTTEGTTLWSPACA